MFNKKILITGSSGYLGFELVNFLNKRYKIITFDLNDGQDLKNKKHIQKVFENNKIDLVIHLAAMAGVEKDTKEYGNYFENNIQGTFNLLEAMRENNVKNILFASSCSVMGNNNNAKEYDLPKPESFYGISKLIGENLIEYYWRNHDFKYNFFRIYNIIGHGGKSDFNSQRLIPTLIESVYNNQKVNIFLQSNKKDPCIRDYVDIKFVCQVIDGFIEKQTNKTINIGSGKGISVQEMVNKIFKILGKTVKTKKVKKRFGDPDESVSNTKELKRLGFIYNKSIEEIVKEYAKSTN